jgi:hypothetical protein
MTDACRIKRSGSLGVKRRGSRFAWRRLREHCLPNGDDDARGQRNDEAGNYYPLNALGMLISALSLT